MKKERLKVISRMTKFIVKVCYKNKFAYKLYSRKRNKNYACNFISEERGWRNK